MAWGCGSLLRSLISTVRSSSIRSSTLPRLRPSPSLQAPRRSLFTIPRTTNRALGCAKSPMPLYSVVAATHLTSHIAIQARACCELSQGTLSFNRTCQAH